MLKPTFAFSGHKDTLLPQDLSLFCKLDLKERNFPSLACLGDRWSSSYFEQWFDRSSAALVVFCCSLATKVLPLRTLITNNRSSQPQLRQSKTKQHHFRTSGCSFVNPPPPQQLLCCTCCVVFCKFGNAFREQWQPWIWHLFDVSELRADISLQKIFQNYSCLQFFCDRVGGSIQVSCGLWIWKKENSVKSSFL